MARHTTFKLVVRPRIFDAKSKEDITVCGERGRTVVFLSYSKFGSNMLVSDAGFDGLVIKTSARATKAEECPCMPVKLSIAQLVALGQAAGLTGMEFAATIPGGVRGGVRECRVLRKK